MRTCSLPECDRAHRARGLCAMHWKQTYGKPTTYLITCSVCKEEHHSSRPTGMYCSETCRGIDQRRRPSTELIPWTPQPRWMRKAWLKPRQPRPRRWYAGRCRRCETSFVSDQPAARYCSRACLNLDGHARRRATKKGAFVAIVYRARVFERDKWTCKICHRKVKRNAVAPHPRAPVLDHVIPLAKGGTHEPANVQCAHFMCNSIKQDKGGNEQLALIG
jgi:HNH endonuclease